MNYGMGKEINETKHGINEIKDVINLFAYDVKIPSETLGGCRLKTRSEISEEYPLYGQWMGNLKVFTNYLKNVGLDTSVESYKARVHNIPAGLALLDITSRMQFHRAFDEYIETYMEDNVGWGFFRIQPEFMDGELKSMKAFIGDQEIDLSKAVQVQLIDWDGRLREEYDLVDLGVGTSTFIPALQVNDASMGNQAIHDEAEKRHGALNKSDIRKTMVRSVMEFPLMRLITENDEDLMIGGYETPVFTELDYCHDIPLMSHLKYIKLVNDLKDEDRFNNLREFSLLNLFRWGILDGESWNRGTKIVDAIINAPTLEKHPDQTIVDAKLMAWATAVLEQIAKGKPIPPEKADEIFVSGSTISKIASMLSRSYLIINALVVTDIEKDDLGFRPARIALRAKREITTRYQSINRLNTDQYKIVEIDDENNIIGIIKPIDIMAIVNHDIKATVISYEGIVNEDPEANKFYNAIYEYKGA